MFACGSFVVGGLGIDGSEMGREDAVGWVDGIDGMDGMGAVGMLFGGSALVRLFIFLCSMC